jgi:hypothetical protein
MAGSEAIPGKLAAVFRLELREKSIPELPENKF